MTFTKEQMEVLSAYEQNFFTAIKADWSRSVGRTGVETLYNIWVCATGTLVKVNPNCSHCVLSLLKEIGNAYFADKEELAKEHKVEVIEDSPAPVRKEVKTRKPRAKKTA